jgi:hypothetical protein
MEKLDFPSGMDMSCATCNRNFAKTSFSLLLIQFLAIFSLEGKAQTPLDANLSTSNNTGIFSLVIPDSTNISEIELQIGSNGNPSEVFEHTFVYDQTSGLSTGLSFSRSGVNINLGLGTLTTLNIYHVKTRLKNGSGTWGDWYEFVGN